MSRTQRLVVVLVLNLALVAGLVAVGVGAHSIAVLAEGGDYLLDAAGVAVALVAIRLAARPAAGKPLGGRPKATTVAALINAGWLLILELLVAVAALDRLAIPQVPATVFRCLSSAALPPWSVVAGALVPAR